MTFERYHRKHKTRLEASSWSEEEGYKTTKNYTRKFNRRRHQKLAVGLIWTRQLMVEHRHRKQVLNWQPEAGDQINQRKGGKKPVSMMTTTMMMMIYCMYFIFIHSRQDLFILYCITGILYFLLYFVYNIARPLNQTILFRLGLYLFMNSSQSPYIAGGKLNVLVSLIR